MIKTNKRLVFIVASFLLVILYSIIIIFPLTLSNNLKDSNWDGTVASSFDGGNGTSDNPYIISNAGELAYLKSLLESEDNNYYLDKNYKITSSINYGGYDFTINTNNTFKGKIDGQGNTISNFKVTNNIFNNLEESTLINIALKEISYTSDSETGAILTRESNKSTFDRVIIEAKVENNKNYGGLIYKDNESVLKNIILKSDINSSNDNISTLINEANNTEVTNLLIKKDTYDIIKNNNTKSLSVDYFKIVGSNIELDNKESIHKYSNDDYNIRINNDTFILSSKNAKRLLKSNKRLASVLFEEHKSEITEDTIYINDLDSDYNYYTGLNYVTNNDGNLPTLENKNKYNKSNLIKVMVSYSSIENNSENILTGYISDDEHQTKIVYYKYYPVINNTVTIKLIDNPFTNRPTNKGFNNWISDIPGVTLSLDRELYERYATINVIKNDSGEYDDLALSFHASYVDAKVANVSSTDWPNIFNKFDDEGLVKLETVKKICDDYDMSGYYEQKVAEYYEYYSGYTSSGSYNNNRRCYYNTCTYYVEVENEKYDPNKKYYTWNSGFVAISPESLNITCHNEVISLNNMAGYYVAREFSYGASYTGYYNIEGNKVSGTCNQNKCTYYEFLQSFDNNGNVYKIDENSDYYYLATRDTNIAYLSGNISGSWGSTYTKPFTFTGLYNGTRSNYAWNVNNTNVNIYNDTTIENMTIYSQKEYHNEDPSLSSTRSGGSWWGSTVYYGNIIANYNNLKIGRGLKQRNNYTNFDSFVGGNSSVGSNGNDKKYNLIIESGFYSNGSVTEVPDRQTSDTLYIEANVVYGNDIDRVTNNNNNLIVYFCVSSSWAGKLYSSRESLVEINVKSGSFGTGKSDMYTGIYVGGRSYGTHNAARSIKVDGGYIYNLIGGPLTAQSRANKNDTYIYQTGGVIDMIVAGAGRSATYGNRIISLTGGIVNYSVFGGSNGSGTDSTNGDGTLNGTSYIYVGGTSTIGDENLVKNNSTLFGAEAGSIFGIGNGKSGYSNIGSNDNSNIIIDGEAHIRNNIYGGGNFGATGLSGSVTKTTTNIEILGGTIDNSIYGGGNQNGAGNTDTNANINIVMSDGHILGNIYGGSNTSGTIYGNTNIQINGGVIDNNIYGGGKGYNTFVSKDVNVTIGEENLIPLINGSVYGGSAFGTTNATSASGNSEGKTTLTVNNATILNSVFGGGEGSISYTPHVNGNIKVNINGGSITNVYGGHDQAGDFTKSNELNLNGGTIENAFGGGNKSNITTTNVYLKGSIVNTLYGGSNLSGSVQTANVYLENGTVNNTFGGNNQGGTSNTTNVIVEGSIKVLTSIYGGGNQVNVSTSNVDLISSTISIPNVFGGGKNASVNTSIINQKGARAQNIYGGSNSSGTVNISTINHINGISENIYGGNNQGGETINGTINYLNGESTNIFGGGNETKHSSANINVTNGKITNIYGGGNAEGVNSSVVTIGNENTNNLNITNVYGGSNSSGEIYTPSLIINAGIISNVYGGNNQGGTTQTSNIVMNNGTITEALYGGGNKAVVTGTVSIKINGGEINNLFGAGNLANVNSNINILINNSTIKDTIYGGGNEARVLGNTTVSIKNSKADQIYAGGNGSTAIVEGNTTVNIGENVIVGTSASKGIRGSVFAGGNSAPTGTEDRNYSTATVNILGGTIYGNIYGGANTSVVYGQTYIRIGKEAVNNQELLNDLNNSDIAIRGTVFGGGETNKNNSETFDYDAISVTQGIDILIDAKGHNEFKIQGSIFGSGNASNTPADKPSNVLIKNYGTINNPEYNLSIQRVKNLIIDNSAIELSGVRDSTDDYHPTDLFSLNRIKSMIIKNNTTLFLRQGTNYLEELKSYDSTNAKEKVIINEDGKVEKTTDNRIYVVEGRHINLAHDGSATDYANTYGMTFFGMYTINSSNKINMKMYSPSITTGTKANWADVPTSGSYVLGKHESNHNAKEDGFYSNFMDEESLTYIVKYIEPTPTSSSYYYWMIGENVIEYNITLVASKYSTLGTQELSLRGLDKPNTSFQLLGFDYSNLVSGVTLTDKSSIKGVAKDISVANNTFGLNMQSSNIGWLNWGSTSFYSSESNPYSGTNYYIGDSTDDAPSLLFYLYHYKNLSETKSIGSVAIQLMAITKIDDINSELQRIVIQIDLSTAVFDTNEYEGSMTPGKKYELFTSTTTKITDNSSFSAYYSLYGGNTNLYKKGYKHVLTSNYIFPENTKLTLIDMSLDTPKYYYYIITGEDERKYREELNTYNEVSYRLSNFKLMGTLSDNHYDDEIMNDLYYHDSNSLEEFIIQVDFENTNINSNELNKYLYPELQDANGNLIISALAIERDTLNFSIYKGSNAMIDLKANLNNDTIYNGNNSQINIETSLDRDHESSDIISDTRYYEDNMGVVLYFTSSSKDSNGNTTIERVSGNTLLGSFFTVNGINYYPDANGETKLKFADRVGNIKSNIIFNLTHANIPTGDYFINIAIFASNDGIHYSSADEKISEIKVIPVKIVESNYGLKTTLDDESIIIVNNQKERYINGTIDYTSHLTDPNIRLKLYRRNYENVYDYNYDLVNVKDYITNDLTITNKKYTYLLIRNPKDNNNFSLTLKDDYLLTGTYRLDFELYDANEYIGKNSIYIVIKNEHYE